MATEPYLSLLKAMKYAIVQFSFCSTRDHIAARFEHFSPSPTELLRTMSTLTESGIKVSCRWQPYIPGFSEPPEEFISRISTTGCHHIALEHLKVPLERQHPLWSDLTEAAGRDFHTEYKSLGAKRDAREFVLPASAKIQTIMQTAKIVRAKGMTFGAADNEFQYLSDTGCCCSGADQFPGFEKWFKHQIGYAVRKCVGKTITYDAISREWAPSGSIDRYLNSHSRLSKRSELSGSLYDHVRVRWNDPKAPGSPATFFGVIPTAEATSAGNRKYTWEQETLAILAESITGRANE